MSNEILLQNILDRLDKLDEKLDSRIEFLSHQIDAKVEPLKEFKWKIIGASGITSAVLSILITIAIQVILK